MWPSCAMRVVSPRRTALSTHGTDASTPTPTRGPRPKRRSRSRWRSFVRNARTAPAKPAVREVSMGRAACKWIIRILAAIYLAALAIGLIGTLFWLGQVRDPLPWVFVVMLGQPWVGRVGGMPEALRPWPSAAAPLLNLALLHGQCRWDSRRRGREDLPKSWSIRFDPRHSPHDRQRPHHLRGDLAHRPHERLRWREQADGSSHSRPVGSGRSCPG